MKLMGRILILLIQLLIIVVTMTCSYAEACSPHTPNPALKAPPPPPYQKRDVQEDL